MLGSVWCFRKRLALAALGADMAGGLQEQLWLPGQKCWKPGDRWVWWGGVRVETCLPTRGKRVGRHRSCPGLCSGDRARGTVLLGVHAGQMQDKGEFG